MMLRAELFPQKRQHTFVEHVRHFVGNAGHRHNPDAIHGAGKTPGRPFRVLKDHSAWRKHGLLKIGRTHIPAVMAQHGPNMLRRPLVRHKIGVQRRRNPLAGAVVRSRTQAPVYQHGGTITRCVPKLGRQMLRVVPDGQEPLHDEPAAFQFSSDKGGVRIQCLAADKLFAR